MWGKIGGFTVVISNLLLMLKDKSAAVLRVVIGACGVLLQKNSSEYLSLCVKRYYFDKTEQPIVSEDAKIGAKKDKKLASSNIKATVSADYLECKDQCLPLPIVGALAG